MSRFDRDTVLDAVLSVNKDRPPPPLLDAVLPDRGSIFTAGEPVDDSRHALLISTLRQMQRTPALRGAMRSDVPVFEEIMAGLTRGGLSGAESGVGISQMVLDLSEQMTGETPVGSWIRDQIRLSRELITTSKIVVERPRDQDAVSRQIEDIFSAVPQFASQIGAGIATSGMSVPVQIAAFSGTAAGPVVGAQYLEAIDAGQPPGEAAIEAGGAGLITMATNLPVGKAMFTRIGTQHPTLLRAARTQAGRMGITGVGESLQELAENVLITTWASLIRDGDPIAEEIWSGDPEYWSGVLREMISGLILGSGGKAFVDAVTPSELQKIAETTDRPMTPQERTIAFAALRAFDPVRSGPAPVPGAASETISFVEMAWQLGAVPSEELNEARAWLREAIDNEQDQETGENLTAEEIERARLAQQMLPSEGAAEGTEGTAESAAETESTQETETETQAEGTARAPDLRPLTEAEPPRTIKQRIREMVRGAEGTITMSESQALRAQLRAQARTARVVEQETRRAERERAREQLAQVRSDLRTEMRRRLNDLRQAARQRERSIDAKREQLLVFIRENLEGKIDKKFLTRIARIKTQKNLDAAIEQVKSEALQIEHRAVVDRLKKRIGTVKPETFLPEYRDALNALIDSAQLTGMTERTRRRLEGLRDFLTRHPDHRVRGSLIEELGRLDRAPVGELSTEEAIDLDAALVQIIEQGREASRQRELREALRDRQARRAVRRELSESRAIRQRRITRTGRVRRIADATPLRLAAGLDENTTIEDLARILGDRGDGSHTMKYLYGDVFSGMVETLRIKHEAADMLADVLREVGLPAGTAASANLSESLASPLRNAPQKLLAALDPRNVFRGDEDSGARVRDIQLSDGRTIRVTPAQRMHLAALVADPSTHDLIIFDQVPITLKGRKRGEVWTLRAEDVDAILSTMTRAERRIVDRMLAHVNGPLRQIISTWSIRHLGHDITSSRTWFSRHRMVDPNRGEQVEMSLENVDAQLAVAAGITPDAAISADGVSLVKARGNDTSSPIIVGDIFIEFMSIAQRSAAVAHLGPAVRQAMRILNDGEVMQAIGDSNRSLAVKRFSGAYQQLVSEMIGRPDDHSWINRLGRKLIDNATIAILSINPKVALYQPASLWAATSEIERSFLMAAAREGAAADRSITERYTTDPYLRERLEGSVTGFIIEGGADFSRRARGVIGKRRNYQDAAMFMTRMMDSAAIKTIWRAAEIKVNAQRRRMGLPPLEIGSPELNERAGAIARRVVTRTQPTFDALHTSALGVEAKKSLGAKLFTPFRSQRSKNWSLILRMWHESRRGHQRRRQAAVHIAEILAMQSMTIAAITAAYNWLVDAPEDEEEALTDYLKDVVSLMAGNPLLFGAIGNVINAAIDPEDRPFVGGLNPALEAPVDLSRASVNTVSMAFDDDVDGEDIVNQFFDGLESIGTIMGWPVVWPLRTLRRIIRNQDEGEVIE